MRLAGITGAVLIAVALGAGQAPRAAEIQQRQMTFAPPVNDTPRWYSVTASGAANGVVLARSLSTGQPVGYLTPGYRFLAFGSDQQIVTLALGGQVAFIPAVAATQLYPTAPTLVEWKAYGPTLEERAEEERKAAKAAQAGGLEPLSFKKQAEEKQAMSAMQAGGVPMGGAYGAGAGAAGGMGGAI